MSESVAGGQRLALRLDDVGAASKRYEVYSNRSWRYGPVRVSGNWLFLKYLSGWKACGPYRELSAREWDVVFEILRRRAAKLTVAITATWVDRSGQLTPFPKRFPEEAAMLKKGIKERLIEIANHGLTHCVLKDHAFRPRWFASNRRYHREFWEWVPDTVQERHIQRSQDILQGYFEVPVVTFVPPGNVYTAATLDIAARHGLEIVSCDAEPGRHGSLTIVGNRRVVPFHDRDLVINGTDWLETTLATHTGARFCTVRELVASTPSLG